MSSEAPSMATLAGPFGYTFPTEEGISEPPGASDHQPLLNSPEDLFLGNFFSQQMQFSLGGSGFTQVQGHSTSQTGENLDGGDSLAFLIEEAPPTLIQASATPQMPAYQNPYPQQYQQQQGTGYHTFPDHLPQQSYALLNAANVLATAVGQPTSHAPLQSAVSAPAPSNALSAATFISSSSSPPPQYTPSAASAARYPLTTSPPNHVMPPPLNTAVQASAHNLSYPFSAPAAPTRPADESGSVDRLYRFGSDSHFNGTGFTPMSDTERPEVIESRLLQNLHILERIESPGTSRAVSPVGERRRASLQEMSPRKRAREDDGTEERANKRGAFEEKGKKKGTGRRVSPGTTNGEGANSAKRRRASAPGQVADGAGGSQSGADSSAAARAAKGKAHRENLTEEQKRNNHILSEQKRRNQIKQGFEDLGILVPELRAGGLSKSNMLMEAATFLEKLISRNAQIKARLGGM
ncbi:hypothetical protein EJ06DRAFT_518046 [Trichodelitschia bisporula]|uniref:BHLH domain-containing protein n=1 Tax=Trichodelitschia bisporula TaxID=703511 RepID=A0A6G1IA74_9PEZI|nr:hypothetical protein EJ06DRAFT_518046 [Trichodelitschia bisporula]